MTTARWFSCSFSRLFALALTLFAVSVASSAHAQTSSTPSERQIKAAFLYRFTEYVQWPEEAFERRAAPLVMGLLADDGVAAELAAVTAGRQVRGHPVQVRVLREGESTSGLQVLFIGAAASARIGALARATQGPVLIVSEGENALAQGSIINFVVNERRVRFEVALAPAATRSLSLGAGLLSVALNVRKDSGLALPLELACRPGLPSREA